MRLHAGCVLRLFEPLQCETCSFCLRHSPCGKDCAELFMESSFKHLSPSLQQHITESQVVYWTTPFKVVDVTQLLHTSAIAGSNTTVFKIMHRERLIMVHSTVEHRNTSVKNKLWYRYSGETWQKILSVHLRLSAQIISSGNTEAGCKIPESSRKNSS